MTEDLVPWDPPEPPAGGSRVVRWLLIAAVVCVVMGLIVTVLGPVRWAHDRSDASRRRETAATLATCLRFQSLVDRRGRGPSPPSSCARRRARSPSMPPRPAPTSVRRWPTSSVR